jgi:hypothetical protein
VSGATWQRVLDTGAIRGLPTNRFFDQWFTPSDPSLYVGFAGRGILRSASSALAGRDQHGGPYPETEPGPLERPTTGSVSLMAGWAPGRPVPTGASSSLSTTNGPSWSTPAK